MKIKAVCFGVNPARANERAAELEKKGYICVYLDKHEQKYIFVKAE